MFSWTSRHFDDLECKSSQNSICFMNKSSKWQLLHEKVFKTLREHRRTPLMLYPMWWFGDKHQIRWATCSAMIGLQQECQPYRPPRMVKMAPRQARFRAWIRPDGAPGGPDSPWRGIKFQSMLWSIKMQKMSLAAARGVFCIDDHTGFWANLKAKEVVINRIWAK